MEFLGKTGLTRLWAHITAKLGEKVTIEEGKGLSTNDFTNEDKTRLNGALLASEVVPLTNDEIDALFDT